MEVSGGDHVQGDKSKVLGGRIPHLLRLEGRNQN